MCSFSRLLIFVSMVAAVTAAVTDVPPPGSFAKPISNTPTVDLNTTLTDANTITSTAQIVDQKSGAAFDEPPNQPVADTAVTAVDGQLTDDGSSSKRRSTLFQRGTGNVITRSPDLSKRIIDGYDQVFSGTGTGLTDRDGAIEGTAYLTYSLVSNATYDVDACLEFCNRVDGCVFANLYYEFNNELLDFVFSEHSNLKCALYGDVHTAAEKTNRGGQQSIPPPAGLTYIQQSSGFSSKTLVDPSPPDGYDLVFGPTDGANNAPGYMGFAFIDKYDVDACAQLCNTRGADPIFGACQYFNIWRAVVNGVPTTYTCSMYAIVADQSTAVNFGQGDLKVTFSRGYQRKNLVIDGGFEGFNACDSFCFVASYQNWIGTSPSGGTLDATIFKDVEFAYFGHGVGLLGAADGDDALAGTLTPAKPLQTVAGKKYSISFFQSSSFSSAALEAPAFVDIMWNGEIVKTIRPGFSHFTLVEAEVTAKGNDVLAFHGGQAPAWTFIDNVAVYEI